MYVNDEMEEPLETGILEEEISLELDKEYQCTPSGGFEVTMTSQS